MTVLSCEYEWLGPRGSSDDDRRYPRREVRSGSEGYTAMGGEQAPGLIAGLDDGPRRRGEDHPATLVGETGLESSDEPIALL